MDRRNRRRNTARKRIAQRAKVREHRLCEAMGCAPRSKLGAELFISAEIMRDSIYQSHVRAVEQDILNGVAVRMDRTLVVQNRNAVVLPATVVT